MTSRNMTSESRSARQVAAWRTEVTDFFSGEWTRIREIILELEEQSWGDASSSADDSTSTITDTQATSTPTMPGRLSPEHQTPDELSDLASLIEQQLNESGDRQ